MTFFIIHTNRTFITMARTTEPAFDFEKSLKQLETIVDSLEQGSIPLEESLKQFEQGIQLTRQCQKALSDAEQKVKILMEQQGQEQLQDFTPKE
jgi:exodeoxyribonuclease VII small subunit